MLDPDVTETGVAVARSEQTGYYYAVQMFGRPRSQAIEFKVQNPLGVEVEYTIDDRTYSLPPRLIRTHQRCRPAELTFRFPGSGKDSKGQTQIVRPRDDDHLTIARDGDKFRVRRE
jgi:hypothetical protein